MGAPKNAKWYVYELVDPRDNVVFYVGKGCGDRINHHGRLSDKGNNKKSARIKEIGPANVIRRKIAYFWDEQAAYKCESDRICDHLADGNLTNLSIATTLAKKPGLYGNPKLPVEACVDMLKSAGWMLVYVKKLDGYQWRYLRSVVEAESFIKIAIHVNKYVRMLKRWHDLGESVPSEIKSRNCILKMDYANG